jgi:diguanylate cyclase (GGDEF)-like protein/PAS domain S-box-containing protein
VITLLAQSSIRKKLMIIVSAAAGLVVFLAFLISVVIDAKSLREFAKNDLTILTDVIARNSAAAIIFGDVGAANETLKALAADKAILSADVRNEQGGIFASYRNTQHQVESWVHNIKLFDQMVIERPIIENIQRVGTIRVIADYDHVIAELILRGMRNLVGIIIAFLLGYAFLRREMNQVLQPIAWLTSAISQVIEHQQYSLRVKKVSSDELGKLTDAFNLMLTQIEWRDAKLRQSDEALSQTQEAIALLDEQLEYQYINPAFVVLFGYELGELADKTVSLFPEGHDSTRNTIFTIAKEKGSYRAELTVQTKTGQLLPISMHVSPIRDNAGEITGYVSVSSDISEKKKAEKLILKQANYDLLTSLPNRHMFQQRLEHEVNQSQETGQPFALMFLDLDNFKEVNDIAGHETGDILLKEVGKRLVDCLRANDTVDREGTIARLGGDEFTILLSRFQSDKEVGAVAQRILTVLAKPFQIGDHIVNISVSIGVTLYPKDAVDAETLIRNADQTMYVAKNKGRNTYSFFNPWIQEASAKRREMIHDLRIAIKEEQFKVVYQPIVDLTTNKIHKAEALLRWHHPEHGIVSPSDFIPVAESTGMIVDIGDWVFYHVADQLKEWRTSIDSSFQISINKSPVQFYDKTNKHKKWFDYLNELEIPGSSLVVEITEGLMLDQKPEVSEKLLAFRDGGVQVAVDDFGTGYSSLAYLKKFDVDYIKIDQSFVRNLSPFSEDMVLCEAIIVMAHKLGLKVIAEGIETIEQRDLLFAIGCDFGQGYLFSKPAAPEIIETLCVEQNQLSNNSLPIYESRLQA